MMTDTPIEMVLSRLPDAKRSGKGWVAQCPAHEDRNPSLSITEGDDGRALVNCHAGCTVEAVCKAVGLTPADLFASSTSTQISQSLGKRQYRRRGNDKSAKKTYPTANAAVAELERQHGKRSALWTYYYAADGNPVGVIVRWDKADGKDIRPVSRNGDGWIIGGMPEPRPLYGLPGLADADRVYVCEGEKAAEAARSIGLVATTSPHGSKSAAKADWTPLAGKEVVILPDNNQPGRAYCESVTAIQAKLKPIPVVKVVELPNLPEGGDMADWVEAPGDVKPDELRRQVEAMVEAAKPIDLAELIPPEPEVLHWKPFPVDALPEPVRGFVTAGAKAIGCDVSHVALPLLPALAGAIGNARRIQLERGWTEPSILWTAIVAYSGTMKSPAMELALQSVQDRQSKALAKHAEQMAEYRNDLLLYDRELSQWKRSKASSDPPEKPEEPIADRCICGDSTIEALGVLLLNQWRGLLTVRDELSGWFGGFDRYSSCKGGDVAHWLEMYGGRPMIVDRKAGSFKTLYVPRAAVSVVGGIQPDRLRDCLGQQYRDNGLAARLLMAWPCELPKRWTEAEIAPSIEAKIATVLNRLYDLQPAVDDIGDPQPVVVQLTPEGKSDWIRFYNAHDKERSDLTGDLRSVWAKLEGGAARLALVIHLIRCVANDPTLSTSNAVDAASVVAGVRLARWFGHEARRIYAMLDEPNEIRDRRRLLEWVERKGGSVTAREVQQGHRQYRTADDARAALEELAKANFGHWEPTPPGRRGQPTRRFRLAETSTVYGNTPKPGENTNSVDVDSVDAADSQTEGMPVDSEDSGVI